MSLTYLLYLRRRSDIINSCGGKGGTFRRQKYKGTGRKLLSYMQQHRYQTDIYKTVGA